MKDVGKRVTSGSFKDKKIMPGVDQVPERSDISWQVISGIIYQHTDAGAMAFYIKNVNGLSIFYQFLTTVLSPTTFAIEWKGNTPTMIQGDKASIGNATSSYAVLRVVETYLI